MKSANKILLGIAAIFLVVIAMAAMDVHAQEPNQTRTEPQTGLPDIAVTELKVSNNNPQINDVLDVTFTIKNIGFLDYGACLKGAGDTCKNVGVGYHLRRSDSFGDVINALGGINSLKVGESQTFTYQSQILDKQTKIYVVFDPDNKLAETDESNNQQSIIINTIEPPKPTPLSLDVSTDKYYYTLGEQVKISATLTGNGNLGNTVVTAVISYTPECPTGYGCSQALIRAGEVKLSFVGAVSPACEEPRGGIITCPQGQSYYYVGYFTPKNAGTYNIDATANVNGATLSDSAGFQVSKIQKEEYDSVDLSISPEEQKTIVGEPVTYLLTIQDKHKAFNNCREGQPCMGVISPVYTYNLQVFGLPYPSSLSQSSVTLDAGASTEVRLTVYPSSTTIQQTVTAVAVQAQITAQQTVTAVAEPAAPTARPQTEATQTEAFVTTERAVTKVTGQAITVRAPSAVIAEPEPAKKSAVIVATDETYQSTVRFTVKATQSDNDRNADKANAILHVYYYRPPQPPEEPPDLPEYEEVTLVFEKGWNLINLPGEFVRTTESSSCGELGGFVYFPGRGYVKLDKSRDIIGDRFVEYFSTHSFWVRARQPCKITVEVSNFATYSGLELKSGWNFLGTTKDMVGETLSSIKGTCSIEKAYTFSTSENKWGRFGADNLITTPYKGIVVKTSSECTLVENSILPPALPEEEPQTEPVPVVKSLLKIKNEKECVARGGAVAEQAPPFCLINGKTYEIEEW